MATYNKKSPGEWMSQMDIGDLDMVTMLIEMIWMHPFAIF